MKTTIDIAPELLEEAKRVAARRGVTLKELVESGLRETLDADSITQKTFRYRPHTFRGQGLQEGLLEGDFRTMIDRSYEGRGG
ncbi:MAG TPA: DUF2191 domain-containing protein [Spirochaetia bacterium]|nr:DUF2191 domain-containing protein [Spirochaetia bacterium]